MPSDAYSRTRSSWVIAVSFPNEFCRWEEMCESKAAFGNFELLYALRPLILIALMEKYKGYECIINQSGIKSQFG